MPPRLSFFAFTRKERQKRRKRGRGEWTWRQRRDYSCNNTVLSVRVCRRPYLHGVDAHVCGDYQSMARAHSLTTAEMKRHTDQRTASEQIIVKLFDVYKWTWPESGTGIYRPSTDRPTNRPLDRMRDRTEKKCNKLHNEKCWASLANSYVYANALAFPCISHGME